MGAEGYPVSMNKAQRLPCPAPKTSFGAGLLIHREYVTPMQIKEKSGEFLSLPNHYWGNQKFKLGQSSLSSKSTDPREWWLCLIR